MQKNKTTENTNNVIDFINTVADITRRNDCLKLIELMQEETGFEAKMWGPSIVGFGQYHYQYNSGREGDMPIICFSPRAKTIALYLSSNFENREELLTKFGKYKAQKACIHIQKIDDIDILILQKMFKSHIKLMAELYPNN